MRKISPKNILIIMPLAIIVLFSAFNYLRILKEKNDLLACLKELRQERQALETEKENLLEALEKQIELQQRVSQRNYMLRGHLRASKNKLTRLFEDFQELQKEKEQLNSQYALLQAENVALRQEGEGLKARLSSITELKKAIKEIKNQISRVGLQIKKTAYTLEGIEGNRGFLIKDGKSTHSSKIKVEVILVPGK